MENNDPSLDFTKDKHVKYLLMFLKSKSENLATVECHKLFNLYFVLTGLDILDSLDKLDIPKEHLIEYIYSQQCTAFSQKNKNSFGFRGGPYLGFTLNEESPSKDLTFDENNIHYSGNLVYTFPALCCLIMLGDDLSRVDKISITNGLKTLQLNNGCFKSTATSNEYDLRFLYAACAISYLLKDWSGVNIETACEFIQSCQSYDYAFAFLPDQESHGAATFLAIACLKLMGKEDLIMNKTQVIQWCLERQYGGFQGRINKLTDSCYSFWIGGALQVLGYEGFIEKQGLTEFLLWCQSPHGGIAKFPEMDFADPVHTLHSLFGLAINKKMGLKPVKALLNITEDTYNKWQNIKS